MPIGGDMKTISDREYTSRSVSRPKICVEVMERSLKCQKEL
jgi:hypothetical protein